MAEPWWRHSKIMEEVAVSIYLNVDSHHLSQQHGGHFTWNLSASSMSVQPSVLVLCSDPQDYIWALLCTYTVGCQSPYVYNLCLDTSLSLSFLPSLIQSKIYIYLESLPLMALTHWQIMAVGCGSGICLGRRHQWRHSAAVTAASKLVISNLVYLSPCSEARVSLLVIMYTSSTWSPALLSYAVTRAWA